MRLLSAGGISGEFIACYPLKVNGRSKTYGIAVAALILTSLPACRKGEQAVAGVARDAVNAGHQAQAAARAKATTLDEERSALSRIPLPTKSLYVDVHERAAWANPFLSVGADSLNLRIILGDANPSQVGEGSMLRPEAARRQEVQLRPAELAEAMVALPASAWRYGRVIAIAESSGANSKDRAKIRRNVESAIRQLNDLGIVVEEWPSR